MNWSFDRVEEDSSVRRFFRVGDATVGNTPTSIAKNILGTKTLLTGRQSKLKWPSSNLETGVPRPRVKGFMWTLSRKFGKQLPIIDSFMFYQKDKERVRFVRQSAATRQSVYTLTTKGKCLHSESRNTTIQITPTRLTTSSTCNESE